MNSHFRVCIKGEAVFGNVISRLKALSSDERNFLLKESVRADQAGIMGNLFSSKDDTDMQNHQKTIEQRMVIIQHCIQQTNDILDMIGICVLVLLVIKILKHGLAFIYKWNKELRKSYEKKYGNHTSDHSPV